MAACSSHSCSSVVAEVSSPLPGNELCRTPKSAIVGYVHCKDGDLEGQRWKTGLHSALAAWVLLSCAF